MYNIKFRVLNIYKTTPYKIIYIYFFEDFICFIQNNWSSFGIDYLVWHYTNETHNECYVGFLKAEKKNTKIYLRFLNLKKMCIEMSLLVHVFRKIWLNIRLTVHKIQVLLDINISKFSLEIENKSNFSLKREVNVFLEK